MFSLTASVAARSNALFSQLNWTTSDGEVEVRISYSQSQVLRLVILPETTTRKVGHGNFEFLVPRGYATDVTVNCDVTGLWAVVNTAGLCCRGRLEQQDNAHWDTTLKHNVIGTLRTARTFLPLLRNKKGRLLTLGMDVSRPDADAHSGLVAYIAARYAVEGASVALRHEIAAQDVRVITLHPEGLSTEKLFGVPSIGNTINQDTVVELGLSNNKYVEYDVSVLPSQAIRVIEEALLSKTPQDSYRLLPHTGLKSLAFSLRGVPEKLMCANAKNRHT
uniref:Uncharacterized protein n=1 Tax=Timema bartmani TaxID=61472 RepID=A0A7R9ET04_9NEOP|nr:unnamed protein product [Timema bartmani]